MIDKRFPNSTIEALSKKGIQVTNQGMIDTGMAVLIYVDQMNHLLRGAISEQLDGVAAGF